MTRFSRPTTLVGAAMLLLVSVMALLVPVPTAVNAEAPTSDPVKAAAGWLARQLVEGERLEVVFDGTAYPDQGLTADAVLAFDAAHVAQGAAAKATAWLASPPVLAGYLGDGTAEAYAGPHAKLALVAQAQGLDPRSFGGVDLLTRLESRLTASGRFSDLSAFGDFSNAIGQSLAVIVLVRAGVVLPVTAVDFLAGSQCPDGGFPLAFGQAVCASDVDATGFAVQAMLAAARATEANRALDYLVGAQAASGGFVDDGVANANSTGLALQALRAGARVSDGAAVAKADLFLRSLQVGCAGLPADRSAIAFDSSGFQPGTATRATAQAILGLSGVNLKDVSNQGAAVDGPTLSCDLVSTPVTSPGPATTAAVVADVAVTTTTAPPVTAATTTTTTRSATTLPVNVAGGSGGSATTATTVRSAITSTVASRALARTGGESSTLLLLAVIAFVLGVAAVTAGRRGGVQRP